MAAIQFSVLYNLALDHGGAGCRACIDRLNVKNNTHTVEPTTMVVHLTMIPAFSGLKRTRDARHLLNKNALQLNNVHCLNDS